MPQRHFACPSLHRPVVLRIVFSNSSSSTERSTSGASSSSAASCSDSSSVSYTVLASCPLLCLVHLWERDSKHFDFFAGAQEAHPHQFGSHVLVLDHHVVILGLHFQSPFPVHDPFVHTVSMWRLATSQAASSSSQSFMCKVCVGVVQDLPNHFKISRILHVFHFLGASISAATRPAVQVLDR